MIKHDLINTDMTSDFLIYNILKESQDPFIKACNLKFPDQSVPVSDDNAIYVANVDLEMRKETFNSTEYKSLVNLYIKTKQTDYVLASRFLRTVAKHIKDLLKSNVDMKQRHAVVRNVTFEYGSKYSLKGLHMIIQLNETEHKGKEPEYVEELIKEFDVEVDYER